MSRKRWVAMTMVLLLSALPVLPTITAAFPAIRASAEASAEASTPEAFTAALYEHMLSREESFSIVYQGSYEDVYDGNLDDMLQRAYALHQGDNSDDFDYLQYNVAHTQMNFSSSDGQTEFSFAVDYREPRGWLDMVNHDVASVLPSLRGSTDYETIRNVHDYVVNRITYDNSLTRYTAYQGIEEQSTVCQGYALLTYKMLTDAGVPCRLVTGYAGESHAWNIVKLGEKWYFLDTTWDDPIGRTPQLTYDYFLVGSDRLNRDHTLSEKFRTESFLAAYPISTDDYDPQADEQNAAPTAGERNNEEAVLYREVRQEIITMLDHDNTQQAASPMEVKMSDLAKHILIGVFTNQSDANLEKLANDDGLFNKVFAQAYTKVEARILQPIQSYSDSDAYANECTRRYQAEIAKTDIKHMDAAVTEKFQNGLLARISDEVLMEEIDRISAAETEKLINEIVQDFSTTIAAAQ